MARLCHLDNTKMQIHQRTASNPLPQKCFIYYRNFVVIHITKINEDKNDKKAQQNKMWRALAPKKVELEVWRVGGGEGIQKVISSIIIKYKLE